MYKPMYQVIKEILDKKDVCYVTDIRRKMRLSPNAGNSITSKITKDMRYWSDLRVDIIQSKKSKRRYIIRKAG